MAISRTRALDYAEELLSHPRGSTPVTLRRNRRGVSLLHHGRALTKTHDSAVGEVQAEHMAEALGVELPVHPGESVETKVATGVLYRAIAVSSLDLRKPEAQVLLGQLLGTAALQRGVFNTLEL